MVIPILEKPILIINFDGTKRWRLKNRNLHREDGPAVEYPTGVKVWYFNGKNTFSIRNNKIYIECKNYNKPEVKFIFNNIYILNKEIK